MRAFPNGEDGVHASEQDELVVVSHLRWDWVWQRPQHLISRVGRGRRTWFVEEPVSVDGIVEPRIVTVDAGAVTRVWLEVPGTAGTHLGFGDPGAESYPARLTALLGVPAGARDVWLYTPMGLDLALALVPRLLVYDVMDDLSSFAGAPPALLLRERQALQQASVVFTGGRSIHRGVAGHNPQTYLFPSGVDAEHYAPARRLRRARRGRPVAGYVGVIDERLDLGLVADLAAALPEWDVRLVGPVTKIDPATLPQAPNLDYPGKQPYDKLPDVMGGFDVALMPFALNDATRSISPTKTLEYLAAGLPVVSTRVPDVVSDFGAFVRLADDGAAFAAACREVRGHDVADRDARLASVLTRYRWDWIAGEMERLMDEVAGSVAVAEETA
ncbi:MAG: UDP-galactopyranose mutase [Frankiaceae bacterium]|jgi:glycosyltransferase involved in cell wall biosynthesis|nr:UDP-galactopyranose mutase [Frankiaceae bacterium]